MSYFRSLIDTLDGYEPGEQPQDTGTIKLNTNENPYPPSPLAIAALKNFDGNTLRRYPRPLADEFRASVGSVLNIDPTWILVGNGSDDLLLRAPLAKGEETNDVDDGLRVEQQQGNGSCGNRGGTHRARGPRAVARVGVIRCRVWRSTPHCSTAPGHRRAASEVK